MTVTYVYKSHYVWTCPTPHQQSNCYLSGVGVFKHENTTEDTKGYIEIPKSKRITASIKFNSGSSPQMIFPSNIFIFKMCLSILPPTFWNKKVFNFHP